MIQLNKDFRIDADERCYILQKRKVAQSGKNEGVETWENFLYPSTLIRALELYRDLGHKKVISDDNVIYLDEAINNIKEINDAYISEIEDGFAGKKNEEK